MPRLPASEIDFHAIRADLLRRAGRNAEAAEAYESAIARTENTIERNFLQRGRHSLEDGVAL